MSKMRVPKFTFREVVSLLLLGTVISVLMALVGVPTWLFGIVGGLAAATILILADEIRHWRAR